MAYETIPYIVHITAEQIGYLRPQAFQSLVGMEGGEFTSSVFVSYLPTASDSAVSHRPSVDQARVMLPDGEHVVNARALLPASVAFRVEPEGSVFGQVWDGMPCHGAVFQAHLPEGNPYDEYHSPMNKLNTILSRGIGIDGMLSECFDEVDDQPHYGDYVQLYRDGYPVHGAFAIGSSGLGSRDTLVASKHDEGPLPLTVRTIIIDKHAFDADDMVVYRLTQPTGLLDFINAHAR